MFEIIKYNTKVNFTGIFKYSSVISIILVAASVFLLATKMEYGVDFRGGAELQVKFNEVEDLKLFKTKAVTIFAVVQFAMALALAASKAF